jgi:hypothetical protein
MGAPDFPFRKPVDLAHYIGHLFDRVELGPEDMHPYQVMAKQFVIDHPFCALFIDLGMGKSCISLSAIADLIATDDVDCWLVIAPKRVANDTWPTEIGLWRHTAPLTYVHIREDHVVDAVNDAGRAERKAIRQEVIARCASEALPDAPLHNQIVAALTVEEVMQSAETARRVEKARLMASRKAVRDHFKHNPARIHIISRDHVEFLVDAWGRDFPYKGVVIDESSSLKDHNTGRFKALRRVRPLIKRMLQLTATPAAETYMHLFAQIFLLDEGERFGRHITKFQKRFFTQNRYTYKWELRPGAEAEIAELIADIALTLKSDDYLKLEKPVPVYDRIKLSPDQEALYRQMEAESLVTLPSGVEIEAETAAALTQKLLQMCIAEGTEVLTNEGWLEIQDITTEHLLWDGYEWCTHGGLVFQGRNFVRRCYSVYMTSDHKVMTTEGWKTAGEVLHGDAGERFDRAAVRLPDSCQSSWEFWRGNEESHMAVPMRLRQACCKGESKLEVETQTQCKTLRLSTRGMVENSWYVEKSTVQNMDGDARKVFRPEGQGLSKLRRSWGSCMQKVGSIIRRFLGRHEGILCGQPNPRSQEQQRELHTVQLSVGDADTTGKQQTRECADNNTIRSNDSIGGRKKLWVEDGYVACEAVQIRLVDESSIERTCEVRTYDVMDVGSRNQFVVRGSDRIPLIVHNCSGVLYETVLDDIGGGDFKKRRVVHHLHDIKIDKLTELVEATQGEPILVGYWHESSLTRLKKAFPKAVVMDDEGKCIKSWNAGKIPMLLVHPQSAGHGLNLQKGGRRIVLFDIPWSLELYLQLIGRLARQGQKHTVFVHHLIADGTIDEDVVKALTAKKDAQDLLFYLLKKIRRRMNQQSKTKQECQISLIDNDPPYTLT